MKITLPYLPIGICRDQTVHDVEYYTMEHMHEYAERAVREFVGSQQVVAWRYTPSDAWKASILTPDPKIADMARLAGIDVSSLIIKPELDDA
ncbi:hypothetical protein CAL26_04950 [Bordetella genomosp. 9]|uniref:Uncharacterized protein n=1 Tax=Bordetella genomosp. 9 TaxID=1416803 RepID=A0A261RPR6_9BORD|nr:hypothetical protein [Bordetella genomosp. 9]OZI26672.1 hypothetical protein CAL26_04950 [Bordetella genomosp. 9]